MDGEMAFASRVPVLCGLGSWTPENVVTNDQLAAVLDTSDEWIRSYRRGSQTCRQLWYGDVGAGSGSREASAQIRGNRRGRCLNTRDNDS